MNFVSRLARRLFSGATQKLTKPTRRKPVRLGLEALEERWCPTSTTWTNAGGTNNWSDPSDWSNGVPQSGWTAVFDGGHNVGVNVNQNTPTTINITLQNGYTGHFTIIPTHTFNINNFTDSSSSSDQFNVDFGDTISNNAGLDFYGTGTLYNCQFNDPSGKVMTLPNGIKIQFGSTIRWVASPLGSYPVITDVTTEIGGTLKVGDSGVDGAAKFSSTNVTQMKVDSNGALLIYGKSTAFQAIQGNGNDWCYVSGGGTVQLISNGVGTVQTIAMGVDVEGGTLLAQKGIWDFTKAIPASVSPGTKTDDIVLKGGATLTLGDSTAGTGVTVKFAHNLEGVQNLGSSPTINVAGGVGVTDKLTCDTNGSGGGELYMPNGSLIFDNYAESLDLGSAELGSSSFSITMYGEATNGTTRNADVIVNYDTSTAWVFGSNVDITIKLAAGDTDTGATPYIPINGSTARAVTFPGSPPAWHSVTKIDSSDTWTFGTKTWTYNP